MKAFEPDYQNIVKAARNVEVSRIPLYEHIVSPGKIGEIIGKDLNALFQGDDRDLDEFFHDYCLFLRTTGMMPYHLNAVSGRLCRAPERLATAVWIR